MISEKLIDELKTNGFVVARKLFLHEEVERYKAHFMRLRERDVMYPDDLFRPDPTAADPLKRYPRMLQMHKWDEISMDFLTDNRLRDHLVAFYGREPFAVQTMFYFKPPGARGQALHQDEFFISVKPGTCIGAWMAIDPCDEENGCLFMVPGTQDLPLLCPIPADTNMSFQDVTVPLPDDRKPVPVAMSPGDVVFFNGRVIHGSYPNRTGERWRRSLVAHYIDGSAERVSKFYFPIWTFDRKSVALETMDRGGPCGTWVEKHGSSTVEITGRILDFQAKGTEKDGQTVVEISGAVGPAPASHGEH